MTDGFRDEVLAYMIGIAKNQGGVGIRVGGFYDHVHLLVRIPAKLAVSEFVGTLKSNSSKQINDTSEQLRKFGWQDGFGAFTVSVSQKNRVVEYIENQMEHHASHSFQDEYLHLLKKHEVEYDPRYVWD